MTIDTFWDNPSHVQVGACIGCWATAARIFWRGPMIDLTYDAIIDGFNNAVLRKARRAFGNGRLPAMCRNCALLKSAWVPVIERNEKNAECIAAYLSKPKPIKPTILYASYDLTCNLSCKSCRSKPIRHTSGPVYDAMIRMNEHAVVPLARDLCELRIAGQGDPFASPAYMHLLQSILPENAPRLGLYFDTNGLGFTPENLATIPLRNRIRKVGFSVDAATEETYRRIRGGSWSKLMENGAYAQSLREAGKIGEWIWIYVWQQGNWQDTSRALDLARAYELDRLVIRPIKSLGQYDLDRQRDLRPSSHPDHAAAYAEIDRIRERFQAEPGAGVIRISTLKGKSLLVELPDAPGRDIGR